MISTAKIESMRDRAGAFADSVVESAETLLENYLSALSNLEEVADNWANLRDEWEAYGFDSYEHGQAELQRDYERDVRAAEKGRDKLVSGLEALARRAAKLPLP